VKPDADVARRISMGVRLTAALLGLAATITGCGAGSSASVQSTEHTQSISGTELPAYSCTAKSDRTPVQVASSAVSEITLCPLMTVQHSTAPVIVKSGDPLFARLARALSAPDQKPVAGGVCAAYADLPQTVIAMSTSGPFLIHIPVDGCDHYLGPALSALTAARAQG
jgi:hypothetical protein